MSSSHHRLLCTLFFAGSSSHKPSRHSSFLYLYRFNFCSQLPLHPARFFSSSISPLTMPFNHRGRRAARERQQWKEKTRDASVNFVGEGIENLSIANSVGGNDHNSNIGASASGSSSSLQFGTIPTAMGSSISTGRQRGVWLPKSYTTASGTSASAEALSTKKDGEAGGALFQSQLTENFVVDNNTFSRAQIRATFYPKFENEKSDQEIRARMIDIVNHGMATLEVSLKHSGSLFMYAGHLGGAYAKNSFGNIYTAVGVFVLARMFQEAWGTAASEKQAEFNNFLEKNRICISMELVTAVLGDHGQRPIDDYVVVTAVTELGDGKPKFFSTPEVIAFCRKWRLPTNHVWLFSTRKSVTSFFAAFDALCEEGTATPVCQALDDVAEISVPGSKDHIKAQGEILEGLVARIVNRDSSEQMKKVLEEFPPPPLDGLGLELGPNLREVCATNRGDEKQQIKALLDRAGISMCPDHSDWSGDGIGGHSRSSDQAVLSKFLQAHPADYSTTKLQEMIRLMKQRHFPAAFKCYRNFHKIDSVSKDHLYNKMVIHVHSDSAFRRYQQEMRKNQGLWPLYRGFFVDIDLFKVQNEKAFEHANESNDRLKNLNISCASSTETDGLADDDANLMIKLKFLTYKLRTFLIRNGLSMLFKDGPSAYKTYYLRQMKIWGTSAGKQREMSKMLDEWAAYIIRKLGHRHLSASTYLSEAEPFLEQYARRSPLNQILVGSAGNFVKVENFQAIIEGSRDEEGDLHPDVDSESPSPSTPKFDMATKDKGLIVFFPGIPGCAKSALCKEILNTPGTFGDNRTVHSLMGDIIKGKYWPRVAEERKRKPYSITLADKNAPNEEVWKLIEDLCQRTKASAIPVVSDSEGTISNPFCLDALAVFMFRVLQRVNHPGNLDKSSPNAGYVLLMFYKLYDGKNRKEFESELTERFGVLVKMPLLKIDREPLPDTLRSVLEEGLNLYRIHRSKHGRLEPDKGSYAKQWAQWENCIRETLFRNADYLNSIQVPFEVASKQVIEQLKVVSQGGIRTPESAKRRFGNLVFAAVTLPVQEIKVLLEKLAKEESAVKVFLEGKELESNLTKAHITLAHKKSHGVIAVASYGIHHLERVPVELLALIFSEKLAALEARVGSIDGEEVVSKNEWPHATIWTGDGASAKEANALPQLLSEGRATRVEIDPPFTVEGVVDFY